MTVTRVLSLILPVAMLACANDPAAHPTSGQILENLVITGDPASTAGATWTYSAREDGSTYELTGILLKPTGSGPFPAVVISHGAGGNAAGYSRSVARTLVGWGLVCIATNYTHAGGVAVGAPGDANQPGASSANVARAHKLTQILGALGYVDTRRLAAHGHSMGAFVTTATLSAHPTLFRAASHTAGGVRPANSTGAAPVESQVNSLTTPYQLHHGDADAVVALSADQRLATLLAGRGAVHELHVYPGFGHNEVAMNAQVLERIRAWYTAHGIF